MLIINGIKFAANEDELTDSLFNTGGTASGLYKVIKGGIQLFKGNGELFAFVVANRHGERFIVSASMHNGAPWYSYGLDSLSEAYLGLTDKGYIETFDIANQAAIDCGL